MNENRPEFIQALTKCQTEPIHIPERIQPGGALLVVTGDALHVVRVSANVEQFFGEDPEVALGSPLADLVGEANAQTIRDLPVRGDQQPSIAMPLRFGDGQRTHNLAVQVHRAGGDLVIEVEDCDGTEAQYFARLFAATRNALWQNDIQSDFAQYCHVVADLVREVTGYDRTLIYRFDAEWNGEVIAESRNERLPSLIGHHFPASDIPPQARRLYTRNLLRVLADVDSKPVPLLPADPAEPLDMSHSVLRAMSPVHLQYLRNMGARSSLSISLIQGGQLWGLIAGHNSEPRRVSFQVRELLEFIGKSVSVKLNELESRERSAYMARVQDTVVSLTRQIAKSGDVDEVLDASAAEILRLVGASGGAVSIGGTRHCFGAVPAAEDLDALVAWLRESSGTAIFHTVCLAKEYEPAKAFSETAAGLLAVLLDAESLDYTLWFREEQVRSITWAGKPEPSLVTDRAGPRIEPRRSFAQWVQAQRGRSLPWTTVETQSVQALSVTLIEVLSQKARMSETKRAEARLRFLANHDRLTGLPNRLLLEEKLRAALVNAETNDQHLAVLFVDLDHFKVINDTLGHAAGDQYLQEIARRLKESLRHEDTVARWGGDEFIALLERLRSREPVEATIERLQSRLNTPLKLDGCDIVPSASIGVARYPDDGTEADVLVGAADASMYRAKEKNHRRLDLQLGETHEKHRMPSELIGQLRHALHEDQLVLHYQPQFFADGGGLAGFEALVRWQHPLHGSIPPLSFLASAGRLGLLREIDDWVLEQACSHIAQWEPISPPRLVISLNIAPANLGEALAERALKSVKTAGIDPRRLAFEITEEALRLCEAPPAVLRSIADEGIHLVLDDFGAGSLSLAELSELPLSGFKVATRFVDGLSDDERNGAVIRSVVALGRGLRVMTLADGVETETQLDFLRAEGIDIVQGFHLGEPIPHDQVPDVLAAS